MLAVGYEDGKVVLINAENAEELFTTKIIDFGAPITAMHWQEASSGGKNQCSLSEDMLKHIKSLSTLDHSKIKTDVLKRL